MNIEETDYNFKSEIDYKNINYFLSNNKKPFILIGINFAKKEGQKPNSICYDSSFPRLDETLSYLGLTYNKILSIKYEKNTEYNPMVYHYILESINRIERKSDKVVSIILNNGFFSDYNADSLGESMINKLMDLGIEYKII